MITFDNVASLAIWGFGREGNATLRFVSRNYPSIEITILDDQPIPADQTAGLPAQVVTGVLTGPSVAEAVTSGRFDLVVKSPGVSLYRPEIAAAKAKGVRFTSALNLWFETNPGAQTVAVTGTKGKSTTVRLLHHLLKSLNYDVQLLGNVGTAALGQPPGADYTLLELSSYQIADLAHAPDVAVVTSLYPEHAPWHGGVERYFADKLRLLDIGEQTRVVANLADARLRERIKSSDRVTWFNACNGYAASGGHLTYAGGVVPCVGMPLKGDHNLSNLAAACAACDVLSVHAFRRGVDLTGFVQLPHRLEELRLDGGLVAINDSISTVPEATIAAIKAYPDQDIVLLLGGDERGQDYAALFNFLPTSNVRAVISLPRNGRRIYEEATAKALPIPVMTVTNFVDGMEEAFRCVKSGGVIMLSPAAPSFGEFRNFEERGDLFKALCVKQSRAVGNGIERTPHSASDGDPKDNL